MRFFVVRERRNFLILGIIATGTGVICIPPNLRAGGNLRLMGNVVVSECREFFRVDVAAVAGVDSHALFRTGCIYGLFGIRVGMVVFTRSKKSCAHKTSAKPC